MPAIWMDVDVALSEVPINSVALIDDTDFKTREESVVYNQAGLDLLWNFVTSAGAYTQTAVTPTDTAGDYDWVNQGNGMYSIEIPASGGASINNDVEGYGWFSGFATGILPWSGPVIGFRAAALNNALIDGGDLLNVNVTHVADTSQTANDNGADINAILVDTGTTLDGKIDTVDTVADGIQTDLSNATDGLGALKALIDAIKAETAAIINDTDVIDDATSGLVKIASDVAAVLTDTGTTLDALIKDIPTVAEFNARSDLAGTAATPAEVATALTNYDAPTKAEMDTGHGLLATEAKQDIIDTNVDQIETAVITNAAGTDIAADIIDIKATQLGVVHSTTIASVTDDKTFVLTASGLDGDTSADDDAWNNCTVTIEDATGTAVEVRMVSDYDGVAKQVILDRVCKFNLAADDIVKFYPAYVGAASGLSAATIADAVHDEASADHTTAGTMGYKLNNARGGRYEF